MLKNRFYLVVMLMMATALHANAVETGSIPVFKKAKNPPNINKPGEVKFAGAVILQVGKIKLTKRMEGKGNQRKEVTDRKLIPNKEKIFICIPNYNREAEGTVLINFGELGVPPYRTTVTRLSSGATFVYDLPVLVLDYKIRGYMKRGGTFDYGIIEVTPSTDRSQWLLISTESKGAIAPLSKLLSGFRVDERTLNAGGEIAWTAADGKGYFLSYETTRAGMQYGKKFRGIRECEFNDGPNAFIK